MARRVCCWQSCRFRKTTVAKLDVCIHEGCARERCHSKQRRDGGSIDKSGEPHPSCHAPLSVSTAMFRVGGVCDDDDSVEGKGSVAFTAGDFNFTVEKGQILAVCGPVGSGKSTLLNGILDEAEALPGTVVSIQGTTSYVPQAPFIISQTVRENILFEREFDQARYDQVVDACCLRPDFEQLGEARDLTEIGESGVTLSGGQKQRISLARAAYAESSLYILDDPFSALDAGTGKIVFQRLLAGQDAFLKDAAVVLVTHASHLISNRAVDQILLIVNGENRFLGSWEELAHFNPNDEHTQRAVDHIKSSVREETEDTPAEKKGEARAGARLIRNEERVQGVSSFKTWWVWFKRAGGAPFVTILFLTTLLDRGTAVAIQWFLARCTSAADGPIEIFGFEFPAQTDGIEAQGRYLKVSVTLFVICCIGTVARSEWKVFAGARAARTVFANMLSSILRAPLSYFATVPMGRILNRFTYDNDAMT